MPDTETAYNLALDYIYSFVDYSLKHSSELARADFNLNRMRQLMDELGKPESQYPIIHVAGTKGKGSVCALAASALVAAGYKTGLYTSPHLLDFVERIQIDGQPLSHAEFVELVELVRPAVARIEKLTTFEITTAIGLLAFARRGCTAAVIEVGLGGRLDATNVVTPRVSVITSLSYDHMAVLGNTLGQIAGEKAGIIKQGIPVVSAPQQYEALQVLLRTTKRRQAPFTLVGQDLDVQPLSHSLDGQSLAIVEGSARHIFRIPLLGEHQLVNAATAYAALRASGLDVTPAHMREGFAHVKWPGRFELARREPPVIFDSAHNDDSFMHLRATLETYFPGRPVHLVFGSSEDKNVVGMLREMMPKLRKLILTRAAHPRALTVEQLGDLATHAGIQYEIAVPVDAALDLALELSRKDGSIVLTAGSMFVTAEAMAAWARKQPA
jgi:dihydrofolate synthase/folylpolyglutamate synthase